MAHLAPAFGYSSSHVLQVLWVEIDFHTGGVRRFPPSHWKRSTFSCSFSVQEQIAMKTPAKRLRVEHCETPPKEMVPVVFCSWFVLKGLGRASLFRGYWNSMGKGPKFKTLDFRRLSASTTGHRVAWESARWDLLLDMQSAILLDKHDLRIRSSTMNWQKPLHMRLWQEWSWEAGLQRDEPNFELFTALPSCDLGLFWIRSPMVICTSGTGIWYAILVPKYELRNRSSTAN